MHTLREERPFDAGKWLEALDRKERGMEPFSREEWDQILGHHEAVADIPASLFAADLIAAYPEAKVILSVRDADRWQKSVAETIMTHFSLGTRLLAWLD
ncbi:hypothetical protein IMSHALPRED_010751 [Imshaugia aleurites]|uniref:Sulfotransferase n=1 Tax=Imshaugia aleurites TaxID=172621 RepID=A0A8H3GB37_9LECA|nr:hypothetical protein IMSHALPRED_010751 [Imshaugia aleurites]